ncbi:hypothetical protein [Leptotrichia sp. OH3620_COT-345]|nr:hypothetical protein [Leptotrichia sp. OH3620_COT-345]
MKLLTSVVSFYFDKKYILMKNIGIYAKIIIIKIVTKGRNNE